MNMNKMNTLKQKQN